MLSVKRSVLDISLDKNLCMSSPDVLTTGIREKSWFKWSNVSSEQITQMVLTLTPTVYTTANGLGEDSTKINIRVIFNKKKQENRKKKVFLRELRFSPLLKNQHLI